MILHGSAVTLSMVLWCGCLRGLILYLLRVGSLAADSSALCTWWAAVSAVSTMSITTLSSLSHCAEQPICPQLPSVASTLAHTAIYQVASSYKASISLSVPATALLGPLVHLKWARQGMLINQFAQDKRIWNQNHSFDSAEIDCLQVSSIAGRSQGFQWAVSPQKVTREPQVGSRAYLELFKSDSTSQVVNCIALPPPSVLAYSDSQSQSLGSFVGNYSSQRRQYQRASSARKIDIAVSMSRRQLIACDPCRASKRKCSGGRPCTACTRRTDKSIVCRYDTSSQHKVAERIEEQRKRQKSSTDAQDKRGGVLRGTDRSRLLHNKVSRSHTTTLSHPKPRSAPPRHAQEDSMRSRTAAALDSFEARSQRSDISFSRVTLTNSSHSSSATELKVGQPQEHSRGSNFSLPERHRRYATRSSDNLTTSSPTQSKDLLAHLGSAFESVCTVPTLITEQSNERGEDRVVESADDDDTYMEVSADDG